MVGILEGKVVLVTGAGNGIGRECALLAAREGARVIVNDLGGSLSGAGEASEGPATAVVREICEAGGEAVANVDSVASLHACQGMVEQALDSFGALDCVINPAGIVRDAMLHKMAEEDWAAVVEVHLRGAYNVTRATVERFRGQNSGAYVHFTSTSGLIGNLGQANYAAAKMGVAGLSHILAMEGAAKGVRSNALAPLAFTRMIESIPVKDEASAQRVERMRQAMRADQVAPVAVALCAPACPVSGQIIGVRGNEVMLFSQPRPIRSVALAEGWSAQALLERGFPAFEGSYVDLHSSAAVFSYDPL